MKQRLLISALIITLCGCGSARRSEPIIGKTEVGINDSVSQGRRLFMANCHQCHPGGEGGLGPAINNKPLPGFLIQFQIRHGLGAMPSFTPDKISEPEVHQIIAYLKAVRQSR